ncbi:MAG: hypothetical protein UZ05_CHB002002523 [Chlorobi bacterium OLB5]|nr:MAG: hypothetical protein UZ05_CHB002002523 [Chlorobi bacterium OLB5]
MVYVYGCGSDDVVNNNNGGTGGVPTLNMQVGALYVFNVDSLPNSGNPVNTRLKSYNTYLAQGTYFGQSNAFQILTETRDTVANISLGTDTFYVRYDGGKFYQYGMLQIISPSISPSWDLVADFNVAQGTTFDIALGVPIVLGSITAEANIRGKIAADTTFNTAGWGNVGINCYRSEIVADILVSTLPVGKVYVDYYIGDADPATNPSGMVRVKLRPFTILTFTQAGLDQYLLRKLP